MTKAEPIDVDFVAPIHNKSNEDAPSPAPFKRETIAEKILDQMVDVLESTLADTAKVRICRALIRFMPAELDA